MDSQQPDLITEMRKTHALQRRRMIAMVRSLQLVQQHSKLLERHAFDGALDRSDDHGDRKITSGMLRFPISGY